MSHEVVKILVNNDGDTVDDPKWCYSFEVSGSSVTLCSGEVFGYGEGNAEYKTKVVAKGGITCNDCLSIIREIKSIKL